MRHLALSLCLAAVVMPQAGGAAAQHGLPVSTFGNILGENIEWHPFPAFPPEARL